MASFKNLSSLFRAFVLVVFFSSVVGGLRMQRNPYGYNSWFEIIIERDMLKSVNDPPPYREHARMARYIVHRSDWTSMATICSREPLKSFPFSNVFSVSDGADVAKSTGIPYFYMSSLEISVHDLRIDPRASVTMSLAQGDYCKQKHLDPEDPRCAHVIITGTFTPIEKGSEEETFSKDALWTRHPAMEHWTAEDHGWFFAKLNIENIQLLDFFGGVSTISLEDYLNATPY